LFNVLTLFVISRSHSRHRIGPLWPIQAGLRLSGSIEWHQAAKEAQMGDSAGVKVSKQKQNPAYFDWDRPWSQS
jgi:hypothetical protein